MFASSDKPKSLSRLPSFTERCPSEAQPSGAACWAPPTSRVGCRHHIQARRRCHSDNSSSRVGCPRDTTAAATTRPRHHSSHCTVPAKYRRCSPSGSEAHRRSLKHVPSTRDAVNASSCVHAPTNTTEANTPTRAGGWAASPGPDTSATTAVAVSPTRIGSDCRASPPLRRES